MVYRIIERLTKQNLLKSYIYVTSKTFLIVETLDRYSFASSKLLDLDDSSYFHSDEGPNQSFRIDFINSHPYIEKIALKTANHRDPYHWKIEGSIDGSYFVDLVVNDDPLCEWGIIDVLWGGTGCVRIEEKEFEVEKGYYQSIRLTQTGKDSNNQSFLILTGIEFIGSISINKITKLSMNFRNNFVLIYLFILMSE